jgi:hypothetical protein
MNILSYLSWDGHENQCGRQKPKKEAASAYDRFNFVVVVARVPEPSGFR